MRAKPAKIAGAVTVTLTLVLVVVSAGCRHCPPTSDGSRLDVRLTVLASPEMIEQMIRASLAEKYSITNVAEGYAMYQITNGPACWVFVLAANAPRGLGMLNLYCYEREEPNAWLLRSYVPIYAALYTNSVDRELRFQTNDSQIIVEFRDVAVFTTASQQK